MAQMQAILSFMQKNKRDFAQAEGAFFFVVYVNNYQWYIQCYEISIKNITYFSLNKYLLTISFKNVLNENRQVIRVHISYLNSIWLLFYSINSNIITA